MTTMRVVGECSSGTGSPGFPGQIPQSRKTVVLCVVLCVVKFEFFYYLVISF